MHHPYPLGKVLSGMIVLLLLVALLLGNLTTTQAQDDGNTIFLPLISGGGQASEEETGAVVPNQYIVVLREEVARPGEGALRAATAEELQIAVQRTTATVERLGGEILYTYEHAIHGFAAHIPAESLDAITSDPDVAFVEPDRIITIDGSQTPAVWGLDRIDQLNRPLDNTFTYGTTGAGVHAYIIDTGIRSTHQEFSGRIGNGFSAINDGRGTEDCQSHGTHVAGTVGGATYGVAKDVTLHAVRVLDCQGSGSNSQVIAGIDWVTANHIAPAVANMSLGGSASTALDNAVRASIAAGVSYAVAAGNESRDACKGSPARVDQALTIGATTQDDRGASFSNFGTCVDLFAPGVNITSAVNNSDSATAVYSGTSMASPHVAGAIALYLEANPDANPAAIFAALLANAGANKLSSIGSESPNLLLYIGFLAVDPTPLPSTPTATATATPLPPTLTPTGTQSPVPPTPIPSATATNTSVPTATPLPATVTATATATATATNTPSPIPPTITPIPTGEPSACVDQIRNGDFEGGTADWVESSALEFALICNAENCGSSLTPRSGSTLAWLGGANRERAEIRQRVAVPADTQATLRYFYQTESADICGYDYGYVQVTAGGVTETLQRFNLCRTNEVLDWEEVLVDLSAYAGQEVIVSFLATTDYWYRSSLFVDDVALLTGDSCPAGLPMAPVQAADVQEPSSQRPLLDDPETVDHVR